MIDFHSHVLPHIDDGAKETAISIQMLEESKRQGVTTVICTPHYYGKKRSPQHFIEKRDACYRQLLPSIPDGMELRLGAEVYFSEDSVVSNHELSLLALENTRYVMLELPFTPKFSPRLFERIEEFIRETDSIPLIAHVDRYPAVLKKPSIVTRLIEMGCLIQINAEAFVTPRIKNLAKALFEKGMVHAVGSDMHNMAERKPNMAQFLAYLNSQPKHLQEALENSEAAILNGETVNAVGKPIRRVFGKYF